ncbi:hypothetical protein RHS01_03601 [Rhizoctonia solani]|uniref:Uncharacterized protein n=1 Tax=Rhizoctonia solani TaxID=456999 RepID=A0A8H7IFH6_9AGAM|nr:hypothetical protein RHS01_03601 [Rhizoctonia solani]
MFDDSGVFKNGGKRAGQDKDGIRRRLWYCFCNGPQDPKLADVESRGLVAYHALWILDSVKLGRTLPMEQYQIDEPLRPGLDIVLQSPKRRSRPLALDRSKLSSHYTHSGSSLREMSLDYSYAGDLSINQDVDLNGLLHSPSRLSDFRTDCNSSSVLSWDMASSFGFGFDDDEEEQSRVETLIDVEDPRESKDLPDWSEMTISSHQAPVTHGQASSTPFELDASLTLSQLSALYPHVSEDATVFLPNKEYKGKLFAATRRRRSTGASPNTLS